MDTLKCGNNHYDLYAGDIVMDNGYCRQLITRKMGNGWDNTGHPNVSIAEFARFKKLPNVALKKDHDNDASVTLWMYSELG